MPLPHSRRNPRGAFDKVQDLQGEVIHARAEFTNRTGVLVVRNNRRNGGEQSGGRGDERFRNSGSDGAQRGSARISESVKCVNDAPHGAEQSDERSYRASRRQQGQAACALFSVMTIWKE